LIYTSAELVIGWLGPEDEQVALALEALEMFEPEFGDPENPAWDVHKLCDFAWINKYHGLNEGNPPSVHSLTEDKMWPALAENKVWSALELFCRLPTGNECG
jgi:hypothetical protein